MAHKFRSAGRRLIPVVSIAVLSALLAFSGASCRWFRRAAPPPAPPPIARPEPTPPAPPSAPVPGVPAPAPSADKPSKLPRGRGKLAIIIDDMGQGQPGSRELLAVKRPITFSFIPHTVRLAQDIKAAKGSGQEIFLHLPMEPLPITKADPGPDAITAGMSDEEIKARVKNLIREMPDASGINNHMGSLATADRRVMRAVLAAVKPSGLPFIDSRTSPTSVVGEIAREEGVPTAANGLFIDLVREPEAVKERIREAARAAQKRGSFIVIGHPHPSVAKAIEEIIPELDQAGVELVFASKLAK
ncbi:MAG: divergent polysaccharide deacetylase family protein [Actinobacteria bacterium]|nr:divergent polysaccharide deacetylase family protein [Actinomycetota bacterium]